MFKWWMLLHILGVAGFLTTHGVSVMVIFRIRGLGADRAAITSAIAGSRQTVTSMYVSLVPLIAGGIGVGLVASDFSHWWLWLAIGILLVTFALMSTIAKDHFEKVKAACDLRPSGVPRKSDEELIEMVRSSASMAVIVIGLAGLGAILYLMVVKPGV